MILRIKVRRDSVVASCLCLSELPLLVTKLLCAFFDRHLLNRLFGCIAPSIKQLHITYAETIPLSHSSVEDSICLPAVYAACPFQRGLNAIDCLFDPFLNAPFEDFNTFLFLCLVAVRFFQASAMNVGSPNQITEGCIGEVDALLDLKFSPFVWVFSI